MKIETTFDPNFDNLYNNFNQSEYGKELLEIDGIARKNLDVGGMSHSYFTNKLSDITIDGNANADEEISPINYGAEIVKGIQKLEGYYLLYRYAVKRYGVDRADKLIRSIWSGNIYFHDASGIGILQPYCLAVSTAMLMIEGRPYGQLHSLPPKRSDSFVAQCIEFAMDCSQMWVGAIALSDILINYAWFAKKEQLDDKVIVNDLQKAVHTFNNSFRVGGQSPFINISIFDKPNLMRVFEHYTYPDGTGPDFEFIMHIQKIFCDWFSRGDPVSGVNYRFPVCTVNIFCDKEKNIIDQEFLQFISEINCRAGSFNIYVNSGEKIASCCRLTNDRSRMKARSDSFGNGGLNIGSLRVVTINLPRVAIKANKDKEEFYKNLTHQLESCRDLLQVHREEIMRRRVEQRFLRFFKPLNWLTLDRFFSTIGIVGVYEMCYLMGMDIKTPEGCSFVKDALAFIEDFAVKTSEETGNSFNVEEIPGESAAVKFVEKDKVLFGEEAVPFSLYSNQYLPLIADATLPERIKISGKFQDILSGGGILHLNISEQIKDPAVMKKLIEYSVQNGVSHIAVNYGIGKCEQGHTSICGNSTKCPICESKIIKWMTRIVGYFVWTDSWSKVRREYEFPRRVFK